MSEGAIDFLNRDKEVDQIINIIESMINHGKGYTFSIRQLGYRKTFFIEFLEEKLSPEYTVICITAGKTITIKNHLKQS